MEDDSSIHLRVEKVKFEESRPSPNPNSRTDMSSNCESTHDSIPTSKGDANSSMRKTLASTLIESVVTVAEDIANESDAEASDIADAAFSDNAFETSEGSEDDLPMETTSSSDEGSDAGYWPDEDYDKDDSDVIAQVPSQGASIHGSDAVPEQAEHSDEQPDAEAPCRLFKLAIELRRMVYGHVFDCTQPALWTGKRWVFATVPTSRHHNADSMGELVKNRKQYHETVKPHSMPFSQTNRSYGSSGNFGIPGHFDDKIMSRFAASIQHLPLQPQFLRTSKSIEHESLEYIYSKRTFDFGVDYKHVVAFIDSANDNLRNQIKPVGLTKVVENPWGSGITIVPRPVHDRFMTGSMLFDDLSRETIARDAHRDEQEWQKACTALSSLPNLKKVELKVICQLVYTDDQQDRVVKSYGKDIQVLDTDENMTIPLNLAGRPFRGRDFRFFCERDIYTPFRWIQHFKRITGLEKLVVHPHLSAFYQAEQFEFNTNFWDKVLCSSMEFEENVDKTSNRGAPSSTRRQAFVEGVMASAGTGLVKYLQASMVAPQFRTL